MAETTADGNGTVLGKKHILKFTIRDVMVIAAFLTPLIAFGIRNYYNNLSTQAALEKMDGIHSSRIDVLEKAVHEIRSQQSEILGSLDVVRDNQKMVLEHLTRISEMQWYYRPRPEYRVDGTRIKPPRAQTNERAK